MPFFLFAQKTEKTQKKQKTEKTQKKPKAEKKEKAPKAEKISKKCTIDEFTGTNRKMAKTTIAAAKNIEAFADLPGFIKTLPDDKTLTTRNPPISNNPYFLRVVEEERNVKIKEAYVFAVTRKADNDFQLIIGSDPDCQKAAFLIAEVSALPESSKEAYATLNEVRTKVKTQFGNVCDKPLLLLDKPVKVSIAGSLFFDIEQKPGNSGVKKLKTTTSWEIHPVTEIVFK
jgi:hypothetical protein